MSTRNEDSENFRIHIMRYEDRNEWLVEARSGNEAAKICQWAGPSRRFSTLNDWPSEAIADEIAQREPFCF